MTTTTATVTTTDEIVLDEDQFLTVPLGDHDTATEMVDAPNGLWTITHVGDDDFLVEGPSHHFEDIVLEGLEMAHAWVQAYGVDRRRKSA